MADPSTSPAISALEAQRRAREWALQNAVAIAKRSEWIKANGMPLREYAILRPEGENGA